MRTMAIQTTRSVRVSSSKFVVVDTAEKGFPGAKFSFLGCHVQLRFAMTPETHSDCFFPRLLRSPSLHPFDRVIAMATHTTA